MQADAPGLALRAGVFDAVFMSFVLELTDPPQIPPLLDECRRVLHPGGRLAVVSLQLTQPPPVMTRLYLTARRYLPAVLDCRPIPVPELLTATGWHLQALQPLSLSGLPATAAVATPAIPPGPSAPAGRTAARHSPGWPPSPGTPATALPGP